MDTFTKFSKDTSLRLHSFGIVQIRVSDRYHLDLGTSKVLSIQQKFPFEILEIPHAQWNCTIWLHRPDQSHCAFGCCSCKEDTKERYWGQQFCQMERDISSDQPKRPDQSEWTTFKAGPKYCGWTTPKWSVPISVDTLNFNVSTEIS